LGDARGKEGARFDERLFYFCALIALMKVFERKHEGFVVSTDPARLDLELIHKVLSESYWAEGIPREVVARSIENSLCFAVYEGRKQVGFARVISDFATYAYLADVFMLEAYQGRGLGTFLMECIFKHPQLQGLRRWSLVTRDAHGLYKKFGFEPLKNPENYMEIVDREIYNRRNK